MIVGMVLDYGKATAVKRRSSYNRESNETASNSDTALSMTNLRAKESVDARLDCDLALITEEVVDGRCASV